MNEREIEVLNEFGKELHQANYNMGWWSFSAAVQQALPSEGYDLRPGHAPEEGHYPIVCNMTPFLVGTKISLAHSELSEALEAYRKDLPDSHLPQYPGVVVELADCIIRCIDLIGAFGYDLGDVLGAKLAYNAERADHKVEARNNGGKKF